MKSHALPTADASTGTDAGATPAAGGGAEDRAFVVVGVSNRHVHLAAEDFRALFGRDELTVSKQLLQAGEFASGEAVTIRGPKGEIGRVRVLGPFRARTQCEISRTDCRTLGIDAPVLDSGQLDAAAPVTIVGPAGTLELRAAMVARRHVHLSDIEAAAFGLNDGQVVAVHFAGPRGGVLNGVVVRVKASYTAELHIDTDEGNALEVSTGDLGRLQP